MRGAVPARPTGRSRAVILRHCVPGYRSGRRRQRRKRTLAGDGAIVLVASTAAQFGEAGHADYAAAKAAIAYGLARSLKNEVVRDAPRARVNVVSPSWTPPPARLADADPARVQRAMSTVALNRPARAQDVANTVALLLSHTATGYVTGEVVSVAGGMEGRLLHQPGPTGTANGRRRPAWAIR